MSLSASLCRDLHHHLIGEGVHDALADGLVGDNTESFEENEDVDLRADVRDGADLRWHWIILVS